MNLCDYYELKQNPTGNRISSIKLHGLKKKRKTIQNIHTETNKIFSVSDLENNAIETEMHKFKAVGTNTESIIPR